MYQMAYSAFPELSVNSIYPTWSTYLNLLYLEIKLHIFKDSPNWEFSNKPFQYPLKGQGKCSEEYDVKEFLSLYRHGTT